MIQRFVNQKLPDDRVGIDFRLTLSSGHVSIQEENNTFIVAGQQMGAQDLFSIGQPVYDIDNNLMGYLGIGIWYNLNYHAPQYKEEIPSDHWTIEKPTKHCIRGKQVFNYYQRWGKEAL